MSTSTMPLPPCTECRRPMYRKSETPFASAAQYGANGLCTACLNRELRRDQADVPTGRLMLAPPAWTDQARCAETDPEAFFPDKGESTRAALNICADCPVRAECLTYALENNERYGVWGGVPERTRRRLAETRKEAS